MSLAKSWWQASILITNKEQYEQTFSSSGRYGRIGVATVAGLGVASVATTNSTTGSTATPSTTKPDPNVRPTRSSASLTFKKADVQAVFDAQRTKMDAQRETEVKAEVSQLVTDGKLTQAQADAINTKRAELEKQRETDRTTMDSKTDRAKERHGRQED